MCGISGLINKKGLLTAEQSLRIISRMNEHLEHRGPDGHGVWNSKDEQVAFGHTRLSIMDLSNSAAQPMRDKTGRYALTYNGELYNHLEIRNHLEKKYGVNFQSSGDTEVFLQGLICLGVEKFLSIAVGMFAAAFYDMVKNEVFLMRDRAGEKPLYYFNENEIFAFSSELKPLIELKADPALDESAFYLYFLLRYVPAPFSLIRDIHKLEPGHFARFCLMTKNFETQAYFSWDPDPDTYEPSPNSFQKVMDEVENELINSIKRCLISDVPVGFFLSGGIDSSLCAALARKHFDSDINSYTVQFENDPESEHNVSEHTAKLIGLNHHKRFISLDELKERSGSIIKAMDEPNGDRSCIPTFLLAEYARSDVTVAIGGDGGDELFGGYSRYTQLNSTLSSTSYTTPFNSLMAYYSSALQVFGAQESKRITGGIPEGANRHLQSLALYLVPPVNFEQAIRFVDFREYLPGAVLSKVDRMSMLSSLEVRTPFFSHALLSIASRLPAEFLTQNGTLKIILRLIAQRNGLGHLSNLKKRGFGMPPSFLLGDKKNLQTRFLKSVGLIKTSPLVKNMEHSVMKNFDNFNATNINSIWATIVLGEWLEGLAN
jgi:asparagine synthase (glutamine-hydrolysing)